MQLVTVMTTILRVFVVLIAVVAVVPVAWYFGYISRVVTVAAAPDGRTEAVCRGRLPESTEYDLWFRQAGSVFGRRLGFVGTESMGRCRVLTWSPGGDMVAAVSEGGTAYVFDGATGRSLGYQRLVPRLEDGSYPSRRIVTRLTFESKDAVTIEHCARLWHATRSADYRLCGAETVTERVTLKLAPVRSGL
jgi:hypothetical protein